MVVMPRELYIRVSATIRRSGLIQEGEARTSVCSFPRRLASNSAYLGIKVAPAL